MECNRRWLLSGACELGTRMRNIIFTKIENISLSVHSSVQRVRPLSRRVLMGTYRGSYREIWMKRSGNAYDRLL